MLSRFLSLHPRLAVPALATAAALLNALIFFIPPNPPGKEASYRWVRRVGDDMTASVDTLRRLEAAGPVDVIIYKRLTTLHQLSYYFPKQKFLNPSTDLGAGCPEGAARLLLPEAPQVALLLGEPAPPVSGNFWRQQGPFLVANPAPREFQIGACRVVVSNGPR